MKQKRKVLFLSTVALILNSIGLLHAESQPKFTLIPTTPTAFLMPLNYVKTVQYQVTNQTLITRTLTMNPISGVTQTFDGINACANPFTLATGQSCLLNLQINGSQIPSRINGGPEICKTDGSGNPDPFLCSQPNLTNRLAIASAPAGQYAYIVNQTVSSVSLCQVNQVTGVFENCAVTATGFSFPEAVAINPAGNFLYVANSGNSTIYVCQVNSTSGALTNCANAGGSGFNTPSGVAVNPAGNILYVSNGAGVAGVSACSINTTTGALFACVNNASPTFNNPFDMALNAAGTFAYIVNFSSSTVSVCNVNGTTVSSCVPQSDPTINGPEGITLSPNGLNAYIANNTSNTVAVCQVSATTGLLASCTTTDGPFNGTGNVGLNQLGTFAYVPNYLTNLVFVCNADATTGALSGCTDSHGTGFTTPAGVLLH